MTDKMQIGLHTFFDAVYQKPFWSALFLRKISSLPFGIDINRHFTLNFSRRKWG